jgi:hypothetical protein
MFIKRIFRSIGDRLLPKQVIARSKRVIFMTTLYLKMAQIYTPCKGTLEECNRRLGLVDNVDALKLPAVLQDKIWKDELQETFEKVDKDISRGDISGVCQKVLSITPRWLQYGNQTGAMQHDIEVIASCVSRRRVVMA